MEDRLDKNVIGKKNLRRRGCHIQRIFILAIWITSILPLALKSDEIPPPPAEAETVFAQAPPDWKNDKEVVFLNKNAGVTLAGTLSLPKGKGSFPALILIPGSGHYFRTITFGPHNLFLFITDNLTKAGFAVLRFDKRGNGSSTGNYDTATTKDFEEDTLSAVKYLSNLPEIDSYKVGLIGHSEGGLIASIAAADSKQTAFIVLMAGPGISPEKRFTLQAVRIAQAKDSSANVIIAIKNLASEVYPVIKNDKNNNSAKLKLDGFFDKELSKLNEREKDQLKGALGDFETLKDHLLTPWYRYILVLEPEPILKKVKCPVLALDGEKDLQEECQKNLNAIGDMLKQGGNPDYTLKAFPGLNHMFQHCKTGLMEEVPQIQETMAPEAMQFMVDWIEKHTR